MIEILDRRWGDGRISDLLRNRYYAPAGYLARFCVNLATIIWSCTVLAREDALGPRFYVYRQMLTLLPENYWAWIGIATSSVGMYRLVHRDRPKWWGGLGYFLLMIFWVFLFAAIVIVDVSVVSPAGIGSIAVVAFLSIYAAASNSRPTREPL